MKYFLFTFLFISSILNAQGLHYWKLDEVTLPYIDTYGSTNGICGIDCPSSGGGQVNNTQIFDGINDEINVIDDGTFDWSVNDSFTIEFWMKPNNTNNRQVMVGRYQGSSGTASWWVGRENSKIEVFLGGLNLISNANIDISGDTWTHIAVVRNSNGDQILYVNGDEDNRTNVSASDYSGDDLLNIGWFYNGYHFDGALDEIAIFNSALSDINITEHYQNGLNGIGFDNQTSNTPPTADAGSDRTVQVNNIITIMGSGSDSDGTVTGYEWKKGSTLLAETVSFDYIPDTVGTDTLTLTVTDNNGSTDTDSMDVTVAAEPGQISEITVDNHDSGFSTSGSWSESGASDEYAGSSVYSKTLNSSAIWTPALPGAGSYQVYVWYSGSTQYNRDTTANYTVNHAGGSETVEINQNQGSGDWVLLGDFLFNAGNSGNVTLLRDSEAGGTSADAVRFVFLDGTLSNIQLITPRDNHIQTDIDLAVNVWTVDLTEGWGVKFVLDEGSADEQTIIDTTEPYEVIFTDLQLAEHRIDCYVVDEDENEQLGDENHVDAENVGIGDILIAVGDSITFGYGDNDFSDDISIDGRNTGGGFEPILNDHLSGIYGYPHSIINEGIPGEITQEGLVRLPSILLKHPDASTFLLLYGTNDTHIWSNLESGKGLSVGDVGYAGTYKDYMQQMIDLINNAGKKAAIAKIPFALGESPTSSDYSDPIENGNRNVEARDFNEAIDELVADPSNNIMVISPDLYTYFRDNYAGKYSDNLHPNGLGYRSIADMWRDALIQ